MAGWVSAALLLAIAQAAGGQTPAQPRGIAQGAGGQRNSIVVRHVHDSGMTSHPIGLELTPGELRLSGSQVFQGAGGYPATCKFPAEIPLEDIISAEYKFQRGITLKMFTTLDNSFNIGMLKLEYRDGRGKQHEITFIPGDARQSNNSWSGGNGDALEAFAGAIQSAMNARMAALKQAASPAGKSEDASAPSEAGSASPQPGELVDTSGPFHVQMPWPEYTRQVDVYPSMPGDPPRVLVRDTANGTPLLDVSVDDISDLDVKKREVKIMAPGRTHTGVINIGPSPKVYELCWKLTVNGAASQNCFIPSSANCPLGYACTGGSDSELSVFRLEKAMRAVMEARSAHLARVNAQPPSLEVNATFDDSKSFAPDQQLDAGKSAEFAIEVKNGGPGPAYGVTLAASCEDAHVHVPGSVAVGDLGPGQSRTVRMPVTVGLDIQDGKARVRVQARDGRNFSSAPVGVELMTARLTRPALEVENYTLDASPASGAMFRMNVYIHNSGAGAAIRPVLTIANLPAELNADRAAHTMETIAPGGTKEATIAFTIPRTWAGTKLDFRLKVADERGEAVGAAEKEFSLDAQARTPALNAAVRVVASDGGEGIRNGQTVRIEITPRNEGELEATGVKIHVGARGARVDPETIEVGTVPAHGDANPRQVLVTLPRGFRETDLSLVIQLMQEEFPMRMMAQDFPVKVRTPRLRIEPYVAGAGDRLALEQNRTASLGVRVANDGDLAAENVVVTLNLGIAGIRATGPTEFRMGTIPAHTMARDIAIPLQVFSSAQAGAASGSLRVEQSDFDAANVPLAIEVLPQKERVQTIQPEAHETPTPESRSERSRPRVIPTVERTVHSESVVIRGSVEDDRGIREIAVEVNGAPMAAATVWEGVRRGKTERGAELDSLELKVPLREGTNRVRMKAINLDNESETVEVEVTRLEESAEDTEGGRLTPIADVDEYILSAPAAKPDPGLWAVVVGVEKYRNHALADATYAQRDALAMREYFVRILGVPRDQVLVYINADATKTAIDELLEYDLPSRIQNASQVLFYFAGHGHPGAGEQDKYLVPFDGNIHALTRTGISIRKLYEDLAQLHAQSRIVFLDSCFSGNTARGEQVEPLIKGARGAYVEVQLAVPPGVVAFSAAAANQESNVYRDKSHGLFTYFLMQAMQARPGNMSALSRQVIEAVKSQAGKLWGNAQTQTPELAAANAAEESTPLAKR
jgi:hypothetical protein